MLLWLLRGKGRTPAVMRPLVGALNLAVYAMKMGQDMEPDSCCKQVTSRTLRTLTTEELRQIARRCASCDTDASDSGTPPSAAANIALAQ